MYYAVHTSHFRRCKRPSSRLFISRPSRQRVSRLRALGRAMSARRVQCPLSTTPTVLLPSFSNSAGKGPQRSAGNLEGIYQGGHPRQPDEREGDYRVFSQLLHGQERVVESAEHTSVTRNSRKPGPIFIRSAGDYVWLWVQNIAPQLDPAHCRFPSHLTRSIPCCRMHWNSKKIN